ncbi:MAG TPA: winged helix-turn-helix domain-containing protein [Crinalium sp.]|jgi:hypothetical protein
MQDHYPEDYEIGSALWTRGAVQGLIEQVCGVKLPVRTVGDYLKRWGYTPKKLIKRAYEQDPERVRVWLEQEYPQIVERAEQEGVTIAWGDEAGVSSNEYGGRGYAPIGQKAEVQPSERQRWRINYIASLSNQGSVQFILFLCKFSTSVLIKFLRHLIQVLE